MKVAAVIGLAVFMSLVGMIIHGVFGAFMGFVITLLIIVLFIAWKKYNND